MPDQIHSWTHQEVLQSLFSVCRTLAAGLLLGLFWLTPCLSLAWAESAAAGDYRLGPGDQIKISVLHEDNLSMEVRLSDQGTISYPMLGTIDVGGKTTREVESLITRGLSNGYLVDPKVSVNVMEFRKFFVGGAVRQPGGFPYAPGVTMQQAIAIAGGLTEKGSDQEVLVTHERSGSRTPQPVQMMTEVLPGDHIEVREAGEIVVKGQVKEPGVYPYSRGMTVGKAIARAGGPTEKGAESAWVIHEHDPSGSQRPAKMEEEIQPGDHVEVKEAGEIVVEGEVKSPGVYPYTRGMTVHKAIALAGGQTERASRTIILIHEDDPEHKPEEVGPFSPVRPGDLVHVEESFF